MTAQRTRIEAEHGAWRDLEVNPDYAAVTGAADTGHIWEGLCVRGWLRFVRCKRCHQQPIEVLCVGWKYAPCPGFIIDP